MKGILLAALLIVSMGVFAQEGEDIVKIVDDLTIKWDNEAVKLQTYEGLQTYCSTKPYRDKTIKLLDKIHHYDTLLYGIVSTKYDADKDEEAKATLDDIDRLETEYTTKNFNRLSISNFCIGTLYVFISFCSDKSLIEPTRNSRKFSSSVIHGLNHSSFYP